jgi:hypothetical protein
MRRLLAVLAIALACAALPAQAEEAFGRVDGVYYQAAPGVLVAAKLQRGSSGARWADVDLGGGRRVLARIPDDQQVSPGQRIAVRVGDAKSSQLAQVLPTTAVSRAVGPDPNASIGR